MATKNPPKTIELYVGLKIPDTTAITALQTIWRMGHALVKQLFREELYQFTISGDENEFKERIRQVDILVNANKNTAYFSQQKKQEKYPEVRVIVSDVGETYEGLRQKLTTQLGISGIQKISKKIVWTLIIDASQQNAEKTANKLSEKLFSNRHYQDVAVR